jgi:hypothetical protein
VFEFGAIQHQMVEIHLGLVVHNHDEDDYHDRVIHFHDHASRLVLDCDSDHDLLIPFLSPISIV